MHVGCRWGGEWDVGADGWDVAVVGSGAAVILLYILYVISTH